MSEEARTREDSMDAVAQVPDPAQRAGADVRTGLGGASRSRVHPEEPRRRAERELPMVIGGRAGDGLRREMAVVQPHNRHHVLGRLRDASRDDATRAVAAAKKAAPEWRAMSYDDRAAILLRAADLLAGPWRDRAQRRHHAGSVEDRAAGRDRRRLRADRLLAVQRRVRPAGAVRTADLLAGRLEPAGPPPARGLRLRGHAVQLHRHRRQPAHGARADGQHRGLEARVVTAVRGDAC